jgi:hypothetical protein
MLIQDQNPKRCGGPAALETSKNQLNSRSIKPLEAAPCVFAAMIECSELVQCAEEGAAHGKEQSRK